MTLPWKHPTSPYDNDGPSEPVAFTVEGVQFKVTPTKEFGVHTFRTRYRVECLTCPELLHKATTSATVRVRDHLRYKHGKVLLEK